MRGLRRDNPGRLVVVTLVLMGLLTLWLCLSGLLVFTRGEIEGFLRTTFNRSSRADAFRHLNGIAPLAWLVLAFHVLIESGAVRYRRWDVFAVLLFGPVIALVICFVNENWSDPNWFDIVAVCTCGWLVSTVVGGVYWGLRRKNIRA